MFVWKGDTFANLEGCLYIPLAPEIFKLIKLSASDPRSHPLDPANKIYFVDVLGKVSESAHEDVDVITVFRVRRYRVKIIYFPRLLCLKQPELSCQKGVDGQTYRRRDGLTDGQTDWQCDYSTASAYLCGPSLEEIKSHN